jgi:hypothetical protein
MQLRSQLQSGLVIPAHPLALTADRQLDELRQRALTRYYADAGAGAIAVGVHTTQFEIRQHGMLEPVLRLAAEEWASTGRPLIAGACGLTRAAVSEASLAASLGYHGVLLSLSAFRDASEEAMLEHCRTVAGILPVVGFYLQPAVGGRLLSYAFWRRFCEIDGVVAIKIAPFNRYQTLDVVRAVAASGRAAEIALYTGNDDNIIADLLTPFEVEGQRLHIAGGLLGQWAVWTARAVAMLREIKLLRESHAAIAPQWLTLNAQLTDANAALFDAANGFQGCIAGIHEVLRREGKLQGIWCLNPHETLSPGQAMEIDRVMRSYPWLRDPA